ncbi:hypothetical protein AVEN_203768-1 [Araneus ventricosus]|uniref:Uncharacterized protein n=1 Tax=Araneus ventricosus TaxID=182803 RepID=A0A4Y2IQ63_ARAVE|nr:hypothetical protein AVEN_203768-1 [Araneus ventricosus]
MECRFPAILVSWLGRDIYRGSYYNRDQQHHQSAPEKYTPARTQGRTCQPALFRASWGMSGTRRGDEEKHQAVVTPTRPPVATGARSDTNVKQPDNKQPCASIKLSPHWLLEVGHPMTPDLDDKLGDHFGDFADKAKMLKNARIFSISLIGA